MRRSARALLLFSAWTFSSCLPSRPVVSPVPPEVESVEGFAAFRLAREGETAKSRLSFLLRLPGEARIEVLDPLGRTASLLFLDGEEAYLVLPSRRAYWKAGRDDVMSKLLGFALELQDLAHILSGRGDRLGGWILEKDGRGRVVRGRRDEVRFEVRQFFEPGPVPRLVVFIRDEDRGSLRILRLNFNQPLKPRVFRHFFLEEGGYRPAEWPEVETWLRETGGR